MDKKTIHTLIDAVQRDVEGVRALTPAELDQLLDVLTIHASNDKLCEYTAARLRARFEVTRNHASPAAHGVWGVRQFISMQRAIIALSEVLKQHPSRPHVLNGTASDES